MPGGTFGGFSPYPRQWAGGPRRVEYIYAALNSARGRAYDTSDWNSSVTTENRAFARCIDGRYFTNDRAANQFDPNRTSDMLARWERIYNIFPLSTDAPIDRRVRLAFRWGQNTQAPDYAQIVSNLQLLMGSVFVQIVHTPSSEGQAIYPGFNSSPSNPNPYDVQGTTTLNQSWSDWSSAVSHIAIQIQSPAGIQYSKYQQSLESGLAYLDGALPAWVTFSTFSEFGFVLDEPNLDIQCFLS